MDSKQNLESIRTLIKIKSLCTHIYKNQKDMDGIKELQTLVDDGSPTIIRTVEAELLPALFGVMKNISENPSSYKIQEKQQIVDTLKSVFRKIMIDVLPLFFNMYAFLLFEIYDHKHNSTLKIDEEYKLSIVECMTSLSCCLTPSATEALYLKENAPKLCQMMYVLLDLAKNEQFRKLRISSINCIMAMAHVSDDDDFSDVVIRNQIANVFLFFLPGLASQLKSVALVGENVGHKIPVVALKAWGRIVTLLMQDYNASDRKINLFDIKTSLKQDVVKKSNKWKDEQELKEYIKKTERSVDWYKETDQNLQQIIIELTNLTRHPHSDVRHELAIMCELLINNCIHTMPKSSIYLIDVIIILSEDENTQISDKCKTILEDMSNKLTTNEFKLLLDNLEDRFYNIVTGLPRKFNGIETRVQMVALNYLIGYINLFGKNNLTHVLHSAVHLNRLLSALVHICEFDKTSIHLLEECASDLDYSLDKNCNLSWKKFHYFNEDAITNKISLICHVLAKFGASEIVSNFLLDIIVSNSDGKKEAVFLLNETASGTKDAPNLVMLSNIISTYTDYNNWYLPLTVSVDENGYECSINDVQNNIIQICLLVEGVGKVALCLGPRFEEFLLKVLYLILERAGSCHPLVKSAGLSALSNISTACNYQDITHLINANIDYFLFHIERKLHKANPAALDVLAVVIKYSTKEVLNFTCEVVGQLLRNTYSGKALDLIPYLRTFKMFIQGLYKWLEIKHINEPFKTKQQKQKESEDFKVSNIDANEDFSDDIMGKTAEAMYTEDMMKNRNDLENEVDIEQPEFKKPEPPKHIQLTVAILTRSLHCLPSKQQTRKLLVLQILKDGLPLLKEWEDELLPLVHQTWSPLVDRFKEVNKPVIVNYSFQLLVVLGKLAKDFIRSRTSKEALPNILRLLDDLVTESHLKDKGAAYRYSQNYKLQLTILETISQLVTDLDMLEDDFVKVIGVIFKYTSEKQPIPLQMAAIKSLKMLLMYDSDTVQSKLKVLCDKSKANEFQKNISQLSGLLETCE